MAALNLPTLMIDILADGSSAIKEIHNVRDAAVELTRVGVSMTKFSTVPIITALSAAVKAAGNFAGTLSKTNVVFDDMTDAVLDWSENSIDAMGMAQSTALEMASTYGDMAENMGLVGTAATNMSMNMVQLAADLASFKNKSLPEVNTALTAIFTGETEAMKQLGIIMTQANLEAYALEQGITKSISAMTQAELVQLRYAYVMAQSSNAHGDFVRTGEEINNQTRKLGQTIKQLGDSYGTFLVDKVASGIGALQSAAQWLIELDDGTKQIIIDVGLMVAAAGPLLMVGGKVLGMLATLKTIMFSFAPSPVTLAVNTLLASMAALYAISRDNRDEIDRNSADFKRLKGIVAGGASGEITINDSQVQDLADNPPTITINADGKNALDEAQSIADKLNGDEYDGMLTIDGDPDKAEAALTELEEAIEAAEAAMTIDADGNAVLAPGGELERLKAAIAAVQGIVAITADPVKKAELEKYIVELQSKLNLFNINVGFKQEPGTSEELQAFIDSVEELPRGETYSATGEFKISDATPETIQTYAEALTAAAVATSDYASAVDALNDIVDQETERKVGEVFTGFTEYAREQTALANDGYISAQQAETAIMSAYVDMEEQIALLRREAELQKEINQKFDDGSRANDPTTLISTLMGMYSGEHVSEQTISNAGYGLIDAIRSGNAENAQMEAQIRLDAMRKEAIADQQALVASVEKYNQAVSAADMNEQAALETRQKETEMYSFLLDAIGAYYSTIQTGESAERAMLGVISDYADTFEQFEGSKGVFKNLLTGPEGEIMGAAELVQLQKVFDSVEAMQIDAENTQTQTIEEATAAREAALQSFMTSLASIQEGYTGSEAAGLFQAVEQTGLSVSDADRKGIEGTAQIISDLANALDKGQGTIADAMQTAVAGIDAVSLGGDVAAGIGQGEQEYDFTADSEAMAANNESAIRAANESNSPAQRYVPVGNDVAAGIGQGEREYDFSSDSKAMAANLESAGKKAIGDSGKQIGKQIAAGVAQGIKDGTSSAVAAAKASARAITAAYKSELDINSPSRVMRDQVGMQIPSGIGEGIKLGMPDVLRIAKESAEGIVASSTPVFKNGSPGMPFAYAAMQTPEAGIDYERLGRTIKEAAGIDYDHMADAAAKRPISFNVGARQLAVATREETARQQAVRVQQIAKSYGNT